jgi:HNH endonuclease
MSKGVHRIVRWEVFARDNFTCRYCGRSPATYRGISLEVDHQHPRSKGGTDHIDNLLTACFECNNGRSDRMLTQELPAVVPADLGHFEVQAPKGLPAVRTVPSITIFVRHGKDCPYVSDNFYRRCRCRKHLRWTDKGKQMKVSAKTRS